LRLAVTQLHKLAFHFDINSAKISQEMHWHLACSGYRKKEENMLSIVKKNGNGNKPATTSFSGLIDDLFQENLNRFFDDSFWGATGMSKNQVPVNVRETDTAYEMHIPAPGLKKEDIKIDMNGDLLTVSYEHKEENKQEDKDSGWIRQEFRSRSFSRSFNLDDTVDANKITAQYSDGMLNLTLPKKEGARRISRSIQIS
jgi:HSP20 family protein